MLLSALDYTTTTVSMESAGEVHALFFNRPRLIMHGTAHFRSSVEDHCTSFAKECDNSTIKMREPTVSTLSRSQVLKKMIQRFRLEKVAARFKALKQRSKAEKK